MKALIIAPFAVLCTLVSLFAEPISVEDTKGRALNIEISKFQENQVTFSIVGKDKEYTLPLAKFSDSSQASIQEFAKTMPSPLPKYQFGNITVSKRTKDKGRSDYMKEQEILGSIEIKNRSNTEEYEECKTTLLVIGQDQRRTGLYKVITQQTFSTLVPPNQSVIHKIDSIFTSFDSDNKGLDNIGGFAFIGYIITVKTKDGRLVLNKEIGGMPRASVTADPTILDRISDFKTGQLMTSKMDTDPKKTSKIRVTRY